MREWSLSQTFARGFHNDLQRAGVAGASSLLSSQVVGLTEVARDAWGRKDRPLFIAAALRLRELDQIKPRTAVRLATAQFALGQFEQALESLTDPIFEDDGGPMRAVTMALLLTNLGRTGDARQWFEQGRSQSPDPDQFDTANGLLALALELDRREDPSWGSFTQRLRNCLEIGLWDRAADLLEDALRAHAALDSSQLDEILELAAAVLRTARPGRGAKLVQAMAGLYLLTDEQAAHCSAASVLSGAPDTRAMIALDTFDNPTRQALQACLALACGASQRWHAAISRFGPLTDRYRHAVPEIARCVWNDVLEDWTPAFRAPGERKIFNLSPFNGEFTMLEMKLAEMADWVDRIIIVEATQTYSGRPKPLFLREDDTLLRRYGDKIIYVAHEGLPAAADSPWARELYQRDLAMRAISGLCAPEDLVLVSDVDEIPKRAVVEGFTGEYAPLFMRTFSYFLNCEELPMTRNCLKTGLFKAKYLLGAGAGSLRFSLAAYGKHQQLGDAGWHFRSVNSPEALEWKVKSYSHETWASQDKDYFTTLLRKLKSGKTLGVHARREIDESFPRYIQENQAALADFIL